MIIQVSCGQSHTMGMISFWTFTHQFFSFDPWTKCLLLGKKQPFSAVFPRTWIQCKTSFVEAANWPKCREGNIRFAFAFWCSSFPVEQATILFCLIIVLLGAGDLDHTEKMEGKHNISHTTSDLIRGVKGRTESPLPVKGLDSVPIIDVLAGDSFSLVYVGLFLH